MREFMGSFCRKITPIFSLLLSLAVAALWSASAYAAPIANGTVMASIGNGIVTEFDQNGTPLNQINTTKGSLIFTTGSVFDSSGNFYVTDFNANDVTKFDPSGVLIGSFGSGYSTNPESITFDAAGNFYVGQAGGSHLVRKFTPLGVLITTFAPAIEVIGTDWIDLAADNCTLFYTSEGTHVKRFNVCSNTQLTDFNSVALPGAAAFANRLLPSGGVLVADTDRVVRLDATGTLVQTYTNAALGLSGTVATPIFALNLDPDGTSFWTATTDGAVRKADISSGTVLKSWSAAAGFVNFQYLGGLSVKGEILVATPKLVLMPALASDLTGGSHTVTASLTAPKFCKGGANPTTPPVFCITVSDCPDHTTAGTACDESGYTVDFAIPGTCSGGTSPGALCLVNGDCSGGGTCSNSNISPNFGKNGSATTTGAGVTTFGYSDTGGVGADTISACADTDIFGATPDTDDTGYPTCVNSRDDTVSNTAIKYWANVNVTPLTAFDLVGGSHTVTATVQASKFCHGGTNPTSPPVLCTTLVNCPDQSAGTSCDESGYNVFFAIPGTCSNNGSLRCVVNADCGAGNTCNNSTGSPNFGTTALAATNAAGVASFTYSDTGGAGIDTISLCADTDLVAAPDEASYAGCANGSDDTTSPNALKYWLANFVTGGGTVAGPNGTFWTFGGMVGPNPAGPGIVGEWEEVFHPGGGKARSCHWDSFSFLNFTGPPTTSPPSTHNTAEFITNAGMCNDGTSPLVDVTEVDNAEPGKGADTLKVIGGGNLQISPAKTLSGGNIQVHNVP